MKTIESDITIIGAGLTGLTLAYFLRNKKYNISIVEARERIGGRIHTLYKDGLPAQEMGATWLGVQHTFLQSLLNELNIGTFEQILGGRAIYEPISTSPHQLVKLPPNDNPSFRIQGGSSRLIHALASHLKEQQIYKQQEVHAIELGGGEQLVKTPTHIFKSKFIVSTLPPYLFDQTVKVNPPLPNNLRSITENTHTWMGESIKISLSYALPFWRDEKWSGTIFSNVGPIPEMYDHSNFEDSSFALKGFLNGSYFSLTKEERLGIILKQLDKYFGNIANEFINYDEKVWRKEPFTFTDYQTHILPHQNNGHPAYRQVYGNGKLFIAGAETANQFPGYMEGAIRSAAFVAGNL